MAETSEAVKGQEAIFISARNEEVPGWPAWGPDLDPSQHRFHVAGGRAPG
jgi:hypothetical protein